MGVCNKDIICLTKTYFKMIELYFNMESVQCTEVLCTVESVGEILTSTKNGNTYRNIALRALRVPGEGPIKGDKGRKFFMTIFSDDDFNLWEDIMLADRNKLIDANGNIPAGTVLCWRKKYSVETKSDKEFHLKHWVESQKADGTSTKTLVTDLETRHSILSFWIASGDDYRFALRRQVTYLQWAVPAGPTGTSELNPATAGLSGFEKVN